jgi:[ribosomal protein S5]-alanine N-acetyltransferase
MQQLPVYRSERLSLRPLRSSDRDALFAVYGDAEVMRYAADPPFVEPATVDLMLQSVAALFAAGSAYEWGLELRSSGQLIGTCGLHSFAEPPPAAEIGCLLARAYWGRGLMAEALSCLIAAAPHDFGLRELRADIDPHNRRSQRLFARLAFQPHSETIWIRNLTDAASEDIAQPRTALH